MRTTPSDDLEQNSILLSEAAEHDRAQARMLILEYPDAAYFERFMGAIKYSDTNGLLNSKSKALIETIITFVDSLRTLEWQRNPKRRPSILPTTLKYRLWLLPYPPPSLSNKEHSTDDARKFAHAIVPFVREICANGEPYHETLPIVRSAAAQLDGHYRAEVACQLGALKSPLTLDKRLCIEIAEWLFLNAELPRDQIIVRKSRDVIMSWQQSEVESLRMKGRSLSQREQYRDAEWKDMLFGVDGKAFSA
jgi:hypothetical protein